MRSTLCLLAVLACQLVLAQDPVECPDGYVTPQLCGTPDVSASVTQCNDSTTVFPEFEPCCRLQAEIPGKCEDPALLDAQRCRSMTISNAICPPQDPEFCELKCFERSLTMTMNFKWDNTTKECCKQCQCYGDPHCESFEDEPDTWIICDARKPVPRTGNLVCGMDKKTCLLETDHLGRNCSWIHTQSTSAGWNVGMQGSPCRPAPLPQGALPAQMVMYAADGFSIVLDMGERSIIQQLRITDGDKKYFLNADDCEKFSNPDLPLNGFPWRDENGLLPEDEDWLPKSFVPTLLTGGDWLFFVRGLASKLDLDVRCTKTVFRNRAGPPRLNVRIVEVLDYKDPSQRQNPTGFCPDNVITKQGSHKRTDEIVKNGWCQSPATDLVIAQAFCGPAVNDAGIPGCQLRWCAKRFPNNVNGCLRDLDPNTGPGWSDTFCLLHTTPTLAAPYGNAARGVCKTKLGSGNCAECLNLISDEGWAPAIYKYEKSIDGSGPCVERQDLPTDLFGCQTGVRVQYLLGSVWTTQFAILDTQNICGGKLVLDQETDSNLFSYPIRVIQCTPPPENGCLATDKCETEIGFTASFDVDVSQNFLADVFELYRSGDLVCDTDKWPSKTACLGFQPPPYCPCPATAAPGIGRLLNTVAN